MLDTKSEMDRCLQEMESGFELLVPKPDTLFSQTDCPISCISQHSVTTVHSSLKCQESRDISSCKYQQEETTRIEQSDSRRNSVVSPSSLHNTPSSDDEESSTGEIQDTTEGLDSLPEVPGNRSHDDDVDMNFLQRHGMTSHSAPLVVSLLTGPEDGSRLVVGENVDTSDIITTLRDNYKLVVNKFLPMVRKWLKVKGNVMVL